MINIYKLRMQIIIYKILTKTKYKILLQMPQKFKYQIKKLKKRRKQINKINKNNNMKI